jgi:hypothetical protein
VITATNTTVFDIRWNSGSAAPAVAPYSARLLRGTLIPIDAARGSDKLRRTVNGVLIDISAHQMRKYQLEASGNDDDPPALDGLWVGDQVLVDSHVELGFLTAGGAPAHAAVPGSVRFNGDFTFYCPQFQMRVVELQIEREEWAATVSWSIRLEEI